MREKSPYIIGVAGGSASGKTSILRDLSNSELSDSIAIVSQDNYYIERDQQFVDENDVVNFDLPSAIDADHFCEDLMALQRGESIQKTEYTFNNDSKEPSEIIVQSAPVIIVEGLFIFQQISSKLDYCVFVEADAGVRLKRRIRRDFEERGYPESDVRYRWEHHVQPADGKYLQPYKSECDLIIDSSESYHRDFEVLKEHIRKLIET